MAMDTCKHCEAFVDTDLDDQAYDYEVGCLCCSCREVMPESAALNTWKGRNHVDH